MSELHDLTALEQAAAIRAREVSPVELTEHYLARTQRLDGTVGAFITVTAELALDQARVAERAVLTADDPAALPVLHGTVVPAKDLNDQAGVRSTLGSAVVDRVPVADDHVVTRLRGGGLVLTGKTNTPELGLPCYTENDVAPPARTPWDLSRSAGGSSGGAAAAVSAGLVSAAQGSDGGGSIRIPASVCGLVGIKPARGRVSNGPEADGVGELLAVGPLARTVRDAAALLDVLAGAFPGDPFVAPPPAGTFLAAADADPGRLRVAVCPVPAFPGARVNAECVAAVDATVAALTDLGHQVGEQVDPPFGADLLASFGQVWAVMSLMTDIDPDREAELRPLTRWLRARGRAVTGEGLARAVAAMRSASARWLERTRGFDAVLTPTLAQLPAPVGALRDDADPEADFAAQTMFTPFTAQFNVTGQPAVSLPLHWTDDGLPVGVQLVGRPFGEAGLIGLAAQLEAARPWHDRKPVTW